MMKNTLGYILAVGAITTLTAQHAGAQESVGGNLDLRQSIVAALSNNYRVQVGKLTTEQAAENVRFEQGAFDPSISASSARFRQEYSGGSYPQGDGVYSTVGIGTLLPTGTTVQAFASKTKYNNTEDAYARGTGFQLSVEQNLLKGFGLRANLAPVRVAAKNAGISQQEFRQEVSDLVTEVEFAYFDIVMAGQYAKVAQDSLGLASRLYEENKQREKLGSIAGSDIFQAQSEVAARRESVYEAERSLGDARNNLRLLMAADANAATTLPVNLATLPAPEKIAVDAKRDYQLALENRPDYLQAVLGLERDQIDTLRKSNAALPDLKVFAQGTWDGYGPTSGDSFRNARNEDKPDYAIGARMTYSIPNRSASATKMIARKQARKAALTLKLLEQRIAVEVDNGARRIECDWNRLAVARESRQLAEESLKAEQKRFDTGDSSTFVLLRLQTDLMNAQLRELAAENDYRKALAEYQRTLGVTLQEQNVVLP